MFSCSYISAHSMASPVRSMRSLRTCATACADRQPVRFVSVVCASVLIHGAPRIRNYPSACYASRVRARLPGVRCMFHPGTECYTVNSMWSLTLLSGHCMQRVGERRGAADPLSRPALRRNGDRPGHRNQARTHCTARARSLRRTCTCRTCTARARHGTGRAAALI